MGFYILCTECEEELESSFENISTVTQKMLDDHNEVCSEQQEDEED